MTRDEWAIFDSMLERDELERIGISEDRHILLCLTRLCHEYGHKLTLLSRCVPWLKYILHESAIASEEISAKEAEELAALVRELEGSDHAKPGPATGEEGWKKISDEITEEKRKVAEREIKEAAEARRQVEEYKRDHPAPGDPDQDVWDYLDGVPADDPGDCDIYFHQSMGDGVGAPHYCRTHRTVFNAPDPCPKSRAAAWQKGLCDNCRAGLHHVVKFANCSCECSNKGEDNEKIPR